MNTTKMKCERLLMLPLIVLFAATLASAAVRFTVGIDPSLASAAAPASGRLLVMVRKDDGKPSNGFEPDYTDPNAVWITAVEVTDLEPGKPVEVDADSMSFPAAFSTLTEGKYQIFALLDRHHSYTYDGEGPGDICSKVEVETLPRRDTGLTLSVVIPERKLPDAPSMRLVEFESPMLSAFWGRPIKMQASVALPPSYATDPKRRYPTVYNVSGYGGSHLNSFYDAAGREADMRSGKRPEMIYVFLEAHVSLGHSVWADSVNNGPWGTALVKEFIPYLEKQFRMDARPSGRFLTGHSSGGWSTLWVMITHPDFFGGTWSTSPDPVDFRNFTGPDLTKYPPQNAYMDPAGKDYNLVRDHDRQLMTVRQYAQQERVEGYYGGQFASFNAVFSPKGADGQPMKLFDIDTGRIDPLVQKAWEKYDISRVLRDNWGTLGPKLKGKLHIFVGTADTFHLNEAVQLLDTELKRLGSDAKIEYLPGKTHFDLYRDGLALRIANEMYAIARPGAAHHRP